MEKTIYLRLRHRIVVEPQAKVRLPQIAIIIAPERIKAELHDFSIYQIKKEDKNTVVLDAITVIRKILERFPDHEIQIVGPNHTIIEVQLEKKKIPLIFFLCVWLLLFIGSGISIMHFHEDVSMPFVQQKLFHALTGRHVEKSLLFHIPYSIGIGLGMILFFNHVFKKKINEEPSPMEVEMFQYQQGIDQYLLMHENEETTGADSSD